MDTRRLSLAVAVALVLSLGVTGFFYVRFVRQQAANRATVQRVIAAATDLPPGIPVPATSLKEIDWPGNVPVHGMMTKQEDIVGHVPLVSLGANEPVFQHDIASPGNSGLSAKIPDGLRAMAINTNELNNLAGFVFPGSRVDVLATIRGDNNKSYNRAVLQNVQVLSAGEKIVADPNGKPENVKVVTLLVTPQESQDLALAMSQGTIQLALRNQSDAQKVSTTTISVSDLEDLPEKPVVTKKTSVRPKAEPMYEVVTIAGGKSSVAKFAEGTPQ